MSIVIRKAIKTDSPYLLILNEKFNGVSDITVEQIEFSLENNDREEVFVVEKDGKIIAFCCVQVFRSFCYNVDYAEITEIYVDEHNQYKGIGAMLLDYVEKYFDKINIKGFQLFTGGKNYSAQAFYEKNGYTKTTEIMYRKRR